jgi:hypothetical protein
MHTVDVLEEGIQVARALGYQVRHEWLDGSGGGACEFSGGRWLFLDLSQTAAEQLEQVMLVLREQPQAMRLSLSPALRRLLTQRVFSPQTKAA